MLVTTLGNYVKLIALENYLCIIYIEHLVLMNYGKN